MKSTAEKPIAFFEYLLSDRGFKNVLDNRLHLQYEKILKVDFDNSMISGVEKDVQGNYDQYDYTFKEFLIPTLRQEFDKSKTFLYRFCIDNPETENFLNIQFRIIQNAVVVNKELVNLHPFLLLPIKGLVNYMNSILLPAKATKFALDLSQIDNSSAKVNKETSEFESTEEIIINVLGYLGGQNEKREQILSNVDFQLLMDYTRELVEKEGNVQAIPKKLKPNVSAELLRFTYWVLHKRLYTTKKIHIHFIDFLKTVFVNFENTEKKTLQKNFAKKNAISRDQFIGDSVKKYL